MKGKDKSHAASNTASAKIEKRWGSPKSDKNIWWDRIPKATQKQTDWCVSVWSQWTSYHQYHLIEGSEKLYPLLSSFLDIAKGDIQLYSFGYPSFLAKVKHEDGTPYVPNSLYISDMLWPDYRLVDKCIQTGLCIHEL